jgi:L,D-peptidoglycan transpeptidase YkuD (ErfK/YbiS/YcfS/YnhG family)
MAHPLARLFKLLVIAVVLGLGGMVYQEESARQQARAERSRDLVATTIDLQTLAERLQHPCPLNKENEEECGNIFEERVAEFGRLAYMLKVLAKSQLSRYGSDTPVQRAIGFIDDFYNPGAIDNSRLMVFPLQVELLRNRDLLTMPRKDARAQWCSVEGRAQLRALAASFDTYRYCYRAVRDFVVKETDRSWFGARWGDLELMPEGDSARRRLENCSADNLDLVSRANRIFELQTGPESANYTAPWHYDQLCEESPQQSVNGGMIPPGSQQLVVVITDDWNATTGSMQRMERSLGGEWQSVEVPVNVNVGRNGLAWGRGLHPFPGLNVHQHTGEGSSQPPPPKQEGDGRAPAGLFKLGSTHFKPGEAGLDPSTLLRLDAEATNASQFCEDRSELPKYNELVTLTGQQQADCSAIGRCPETMFRDDGAYDSLVWVEHNKAKTPGGGSCIFLHVERGEGVPTAGCTSAPRNDLGQLIGWLEPTKTPLLLQLPRAEYLARQKGWVLPQL